MSRSVWLLLTVFPTALLVSILIGFAVGAVKIPFDELARLLIGEQTNLQPSEITILFKIRMPRVLLAATVGGAMGIAGAGYQGLFRNPLADPFVIGASSGAALGAVLVIIGAIGSSAAIMPAALAGAMLTVLIVYIIANIGLHMPTVSLLLAGVAVSSLISAIVSLLMYLNKEELFTIIGWLMGSLSGRGWPEFKAVLPFVVVGGIVIWISARSLDSLTFGEETSASLGMNLGRNRGIVLFGASLATAAAVSAAGIIGFVGLIAPHFARLFVGARHVLVIPASGLLGGFLLVLADALSRTICAPAELPVGILTAIVGSPFFLYILKQRQVMIES